MDKTSAQPIPPASRLVQSTTWGNPRRIRTPRFNRVMGRWLALLSKRLSYVAFAQAIVVIGLLGYLSFGTKFQRIFASDGTMFSCEIPTQRGS